MSTLSKISQSVEMVHTCISIVLKVNLPFFTDNEQCTGGSQQEMGNVIC